MRVIGLFIVSIFLFSCGEKEKPIKLPPVEFTIYAVNTGKDIEQAKNRALSILSDMRSGYRFESENSVSVSIMENEVNFIMAQKIFEKSFSHDKAVYVCKMQFNNPYQQGYRFIQKTQSVKIEKLFENDLRVLFGEILEKVFREKIKKREKLTGFIYITGLPDFSRIQWGNVDISVDFMIIFKDNS